MSSRARVMIVEDSSSYRLLLESMIQEDPQLELAGSYSSAEQALKCLETDRPDVISLDIELPGINGLEATRKILETRPTPIVIVSSTVSDDQVSTSMKAMEAGALAVLSKPEGPGSPEFERSSRHVRATLHSMSQVKVIRQYSHRRPGAKRCEKVRPVRTTAKVPVQYNPISWGAGPAAAGLVVIGASTGGPPALERLLHGIHPEAAPPMLIVQHISPGFVSGLASWLAGRTGHRVRLAVHGEQPAPGDVCIAPDGKHLRMGKSGRLLLSEEPLELIHRPSINELFASVADRRDLYLCGVLLTGMGNDGAEGLARIREAGGWTAVQDEESSVVYGMPRVAKESGAAVFQGSPEQIASQLQRRIHHGN